MGGQKKQADKLLKNSRQMPNAQLTRYFYSFSTGYVERCDSRCGTLCYKIARYTVDRGDIPGPDHSGCRYVLRGFG